jgi:hypothetical protein
MALLIKRKPKQVSMREKLNQASVQEAEQLSLNKETEADEFLNKVLASPIQEIIQEFYINTPIMPSSRLPFHMKSGFNKGVKYIHKALRGTLYKDTEFDDLNRKFTIEEILNSVMIHKLALTPDYRPVEKKFLRVNLDQFFLNPYSKSIGKSFFLYWMNNDPLPVVKLMVDANPDITEEIIRLFEWHNLTHDDINYVIKGVEIFKRVFSTVTISPIFVRLMIPKKLAEIIWTILTDVFESVNKPVLPKYMASPKYVGWIEKGLAESDYVI